MEDLLRRLKPRPLGIVSDGFLPAQQLKLDALGLAGLFDAVVFTEALGRDAWKPSPRPFEALGRRLAVEASACAYVADNPAKDFAAPNALGWRTIQFRRPGQLHADRPACPGGRPHAVAHSVEQLWAELTH